jgi:Tfp pilus assembly protein PilW
MKTKILNNRGLTLIELVIGMTIMIILLGAVFQILSVSLKSYQYNMAVANNKMIARNALNIITDELRYAVAVTEPTFVANVPTEPPTNLIRYTLNNHACNISLNQNTRTITIVSDTATNQIAMNTVTALSFSRSGQQESEIIISITINDGSYVGSPSTTLDTIVTLSNIR